MTGGQILFLRRRASVLYMLREIEDAEIRIVVMHHPLDWLAEFDAESARSLFEGSGVFVLTGHDHSADPTTEMSTPADACGSKRMFARARAGLF